MPVVQCPVCELRFLLTAELDDHLSKDHPDFEAEDRHGDAGRLAQERRALHIKREARERGGD